jgi:hypothetical protein
MITKIGEKTGKIIDFSKLGSDVCKQTKISDIGLHHWFNEK